MIALGSFSSKHKSLSEGKRTTSLPESGDSRNRCAHAERKKQLTSKRELIALVVMVMLAVVRMVRVVLVVRVDVDLGERSDNL